MGVLTQRLAYRVCRVIHLEEKLKPKEIAQKIDENPKSVSNRKSDLEEKGILSSTHALGGRGGGKVSKVDGDGLMDLWERELLDLTIEDKAGEQMQERFEDHLEQGSYQPLFNAYVASYFYEVEYSTIRKMLFDDLLYHMQLGTSVFSNEQDNRLLALKAVLERKVERNPEDPFQMALAFERLCDEDELGAGNKNYGDLDQVRDTIYGEEFADALGEFTKERFQRGTRKGEDVID